MRIGIYLNSDYLLTVKPSIWFQGVLCPGRKNSFLTDKKSIVWIFTAVILGKI
jgi:hypothetical protein